MLAEIIVLVSIITVLAFEVKLVMDGKIEDRLAPIPMMFVILLPFWNQNLISVVPFIFLFITFLFRMLIDIYEQKVRFNILFWILTVANIMILYFQLGFLLKNYLMSVFY
jgi:hypothetical protein